MLDLLIITIIVLLITRWIQMDPFLWKGKGIPYGIPVPVFGSMGPALLTPLRYIFQKMYSLMGESDMYGFHFFKSPALLIRDPEIIKNVLITHSDNFMQRTFHTENYDPMSKGVFFSKGEEWKVLRNKMTPYFTPARIRGMMPFIKPICRRFTRYLSDESKLGPVDVQEASMKLTVDVIMSTMFGLQPESFDDPNSFFYNLQKELVGFSFGFKTLIGILSPRLYGTLGLTILSKTTNENMYRFVNKVIDQRLNGIGNRMDFVQGMVELMQQEETKDKRAEEYNADGTAVARFDRFCITGQCMIMYLAGTETTGNTLGFLLYELAMNEVIQDKVREEINEMIGRTGDQYDYDDIHALRYLNNVVKETLRKYPVLLVYGRKCTKGFKLNDMNIKVGTLVYISPICLHRDNRFYKEPDKFIPERFADDSVKAGTYLPFGIGPRTCMGMKFAQTEIILALCDLLPKFKILPSSKTENPITFSYNPTLSPANGIMLTFEKI